LKRLKLWLVALAGAVLTVSCQPQLIVPGKPYDYSGMGREEIFVHKKMEQFVYIVQRTGRPLPLNENVRIDSIRLDAQQRLLIVDFNKPFSYVPFRQENVRAVYQTARSILGNKYRDYRLVFRTMGYSIERLIPDFYRSKRSDYDRSRLPKKYPRPAPLVCPLNGLSFPAGLQGFNIAVWNSHGWYYNHKKQRWEWQRPRLFQTVEDLLSTSFVIPYLIPMLENGGANVFNPRERDIQSHEVVVDNDAANGQRYNEINSTEPFVWRKGDAAGFAAGQPPYESGVNPFTLGTYRKTLTDTVASAKIIWTPNIPQTGKYAVYISFHAAPENTDAAHYTVFHAGGQSNFLVNQQIGGGTWIWLGAFKFFKGFHPDSGSVCLTNQSTATGRQITADAVRFGGGMGNIRRGAQASGRPRFEEGARYNLQYAGFPDSLVYSLNGDSADYEDDYQSRAEYVNYLKGAPFGPNKKRTVRGLGIPIDLSLAFHTDAGFTHGDTTVGTLAIYSIADADAQTVFPDSVSRLANRDLADLVQTQIVDDIRLTMNPRWKRRALKNALYSEVYRPNVPSMILELLSHQNFRDMQFALDPRFRFTVARAVYKGVLKYLAAAYDRDYVVQPLPVNNFSAELDSGGRAVLRWKPQRDSLESSAAATQYIVYTRIDSGGFDNGRLCDSPVFKTGPLARGKIYSFKVSALNAGGRSFPSEILSVCRVNDDRPPVLIVNAFDRVSAPAYFRWGEHGGFLTSEDDGVPDKYDVMYTGRQFDFNLKSPFRMNDAPGFGASDADYETRLIPGNTFDFPYVHGQAIAGAGYSFVSCSDEALWNGRIRLRRYRIADIILGEEKETHWQDARLDSLRGAAFKAFPPEFEYVLRQFTENGGNLLVSGAYVGMELFKGKDKKSFDVRFGEDVLRIFWATNHAARSGRVAPAPNDLLNLPELRFNSQWNQAIYTTESPDALNSINGSQTILRYQENGFSAATAYRGSYKTVVLGFPFETVLFASQRRQMMAAILKFFSLK